MPNKHRKDPRVLALESALHHQMEALGDTQEAAAAKAEVSQSEISRVLTGQRKRFTPAISRLCQYAKLDVGNNEATETAHDQLSQTVRKAIGDNAAAALALSQIVESLAPLLRAYKLPDGADISGATP